jgi:hypothetical protein
MSPMRGPQKKGRLAVERPPRNSNDLLNRFPAWAGRPVCSELFADPEET